MSYAYSVAIKLSLQNLASQGLKLITGELLGASAAAVGLQGKLKSLKLAAVGFGFEKLGSGMIGFMEKSIDASKDYTAQLSLMNAAGMSHVDVAQSIAAAWKTTGQVMTSTAADNLKMVRELRSVFGPNNLNEAFATLPIAARISAIQEAQSGKKQEGVGFDLIKAIELGTKGIPTASATAKQAEMIGRAVLGMGGTINVSDFHTALKYSRTAAPYLTDEFKYEKFPTLIQEMKTGKGGASGAGNVIASLFGIVAGRQIPKELISNWVAAGLINPNSIVRDPNSRTTSKILPGGILGSSEIGDPELYAQKYIGPGIKRLMAKFHISELDAYYSLTKNRVGGFGLQTLVNKKEQFERDQTLIRGVGSSYGAYQKLVQSNPALAEQALHSQYQNILAIIGYQILPKLLPLMVKFAGLLNEFATWASKNQPMVKGLVIGFAGLGVAFSVIGKVLMGAALVKFLGVAPAAVSALSAVASALIPVLTAATTFAATYYGTKAVLDHFGYQGSWGGWVYDKLHPNAYNGGTVNTGKGGSGHKQGDVYIDGKKAGVILAPHVTGQQSKVFNQPQTGLNIFDQVMGLAPAGGI